MNNPMVHLSSIAKTHIERAFIQSHIRIKEQHPRDLTARINAYRDNVKRLCPAMQRGQVRREFYKMAVAAVENIVKIYEEDIGGKL
jgi:hypothetical protein